MRKWLLGTLFCCSVRISMVPGANAQTGAISALSAASPTPPSAMDQSAQFNFGATASTKTSSATLTLADAEARALKNEPRLLAAQLRAQEAAKRITESRSGYFPQIFGSLTAVQANGDSAVAAGAVTTSSVSTRAAAGASLVQMITDFGHTSNLVQSTRFEAQSARQDEESIRQFTLRQVQEAYFATQAAESVRKTAQAVLDFRRILLRQLTALAQSQLRSTLDVQFAQVMVSEAELAVVRAESNLEKAQAQLAAAMGETGGTAYSLAEAPLPEAPDDDASPYVKEALADRPDLKALQLHSESAVHEAHAETDLNYPSINTLASGGEVPIHDSTIHRDYGAVGFNINIPIFNGGLYESRAAAAELEARAASEDASLRSVEIARDVRMAWADARDAYLQIGVMQRMVDEADVAMHLAQARYDAGLGSIVELNQAELNQTSALIGAASARFDYLRTMTVFRFAMGNLH